MLAEDAAQDAFVRAYRGARPLRPGATVCGVGDRHCAQSLHRSVAAASPRRTALRRRGGRTRGGGSRVDRRRRCAGDQRAQRQGARCAGRTAGEVPPADRARVLRRGELRRHRRGARYLAQSRRSVCCCAASRRCERRSRGPRRIRSETPARTVAGDACRRRARRHDAAAVEQHLVACDVCSARVAALREESRVLASALAYDAASVSVPEFVKPASVRAMVIGAAIVLRDRRVVVDRARAASTSPCRTR